MSVANVAAFASRRALGPIHCVGFHSLALPSWMNILSCPHFRFSIFWYHCLVPIINISVFSLAFKPAITRSRSIDRACCSKISAPRQYSNSSLSHCGTRFTSLFGIVQKGNKFLHMRLWQPEIFRFPVHSACDLTMKTRTVAAKRTGTG